MGSDRGPVCHAFLVTAIFVMSDLELPIRGRTYREPEGAHSVVVRGRDIDAALQHAAGSSTRMPGSEKLLLEFDGRPMIKSVIEAASDGGCHQILVVYSSNEVMHAVGRDAELVHNPLAATGMASSLQVGLRALRPDMEAALVMLGDQPLVGSRTVAALLRAWRQEGSRPAVAVSRGDAGKWVPPV